MFERRQPARRLIGKWHYTLQGAQKDQQQISSHKSRVESSEKQARHGGLSTQKINMENLVDDTNEVSGDDHNGTSEDLQLIAKWSRKWLWHTVQFIYEADKSCDVPEGRIFIQFKDDLQHKLVGVKLLKGKSNSKKAEYMETIWKDIVRKKTNVITDGLNARQSAVYSAMQNRFMGKKSF